MVAVPGGSIFCTCLVIEFIAALRSIHQRFHSTETPLDGVVIEASGIANPRVIGRMLRETQLDRIYKVAAIVAVADPLIFPVLVQTLPNITAQVECSDWVLINKIDLADADAIAKTETLIRRIAPQSRIVRTVHCETDLDLFSAPSERVLEGDYTPGPDPHFARVWVRAKREVNVDRLLAALRALPGLYRAKGFLRSDSKMHHVDITANSAAVSPFRTEGSADIVIIIRSADADAARALAARIKEGEFDLAPR